MTDIENCCLGKKETKQDLLISWLKIIIYSLALVAGGLFLSVLEKQEQLTAYQVTVEKLNGAEFGGNIKIEKGGKLNGDI